MTIRCMRIASWITEAINAYSEYVTIITFTLQQWLHESASMSIYNYSYIACQVYDSLPIQHQLTCFRNRDGVCLLRGMN
jgi:hypothetical protein